MPVLARFALVVAAILALGAARAADGPVDPQSLVGEWEGTWKEIGPRGLSGTYRLAIESVEGERVRGKGEMEGRRVPVPPFRVNGTLSGNRLAYGSRVKSELLVEGDRMTGTTSGANDDVRIELARKPR